MVIRGVVVSQEESREVQDKDSQLKDRMSTRHNPMSYHLSPFASNLD